MPAKITGPHGPSLPIQSRASFSKSWTWKYFAATKTAMAAIAYTTHLQRELMLEEAAGDRSTAPLSGSVFTEWIPFDDIVLELNQPPRCETCGAYGFFPIIALAAKAVT